jgi:hypothetical protein
MKETLHFRGRVSQQVIIALFLHSHWRVLDCYSGFCGLERDVRRSHRRVDNTNLWDIDIPWLHLVH